MHISNWFYILYGAGLYYILITPRLIKNTGAFRSAWRWYVCSIVISACTVIPLPPFGGLLFSFLTWLFVAISALRLYKALDPESVSN